MQAVTPLKEAADIVREEGGEILKLCYQCGLCTATCPWNLVRSFLVRRILHQGQLGLADFESEDIWLCATCRACVQRCPRGVEIIDVMRALRRVIVELGVGKVPDSLRLTIKNITGVGNPLGEEPEKRADWAKDLGVKTYTKGTEILYFPCCIPAYDPAIQRVAQATATVLQKADVDFGILGSKEVCCGESARKAGNESLFQNLAQSNISAFVEADVTKIVTSSPHCYNTFKNEYPELGGNFEVVHYSQYLAELIDEGRLKLNKELNKTGISKSAKLTVIGHLSELRQRLLKSLIALAITTVISFIFRDQILGILLLPAPPSITVQAIELTEMIGTYMKVSFASGIVLAMPYLIYQLLMFISPALTRKEKKYVYLILPWVVLMFIAGVAFSYFILLPPATKFLLTFGSNIVNIEPRIGNYISIVTRLLLAVGAVFETPVIILFLARLGIVTPKMLSRKRRHAIVAAFILAAIITPTFDPINQSLVAVPLIILYEMSIWLAKLVQRKEPRLVTQTPPV